MKERFETIRRRDFASWSPASEPASAEGVDLRVQHRAGCSEVRNFYRVSCNPGRYAAE
jgi:hypothetical protein